MSCLLILTFVCFVGLLNPQKTVAQLLEPNCGITGIKDLIFGGTNAKHGENPWMAYLYLNENDFLCGGSLIHKRFALTAAHCIVNGQTLSVRLGEYYTESRAKSSIAYSVTLAIRNRLFSKHTYEHDIGILKLDPEVQFNANIRPICIFTDASRAPFVTSYTVTGWGKTRELWVADKLQTLELEDISPASCYEHLGMHVKAGQICAGHPTGDTCLGDSGSPLGHLVNINGSMRYTQFGLVSYGRRVCRSPAVYTRVTYYADWIVKVVKYGLSH
ncbi:coagulation factor X-like [Drosophila kikkawai]|uniref:Coagulation factor X-like n=1 Tax=Drosophila kikkawai TaxID=30033 RepID=A0A6P4JN24_DROKI|nr:coagulation factor X-like [Drosophila kikkawai]